MSGNEVLECCLYGIKHREKYPESVRKFAFALMYHSRAAYEIVRTQFNGHLPHPRTIKNWMRNSDLNGEPGIREETLKRLKEFVDELGKKGETVTCSLIFDEMYIRKQVYYDPNSYQYVGYPTYPPSNASEFVSFDDMNRVGNMNKQAQVAEELQERNILDEIDEIDETVDHCEKKEESLLATRALVFLLSGINKKFHFPVAYHFVKGMDAKNLANLTKDIIMKISEQGIIIANLTFDGAPVNLTMCKILGANLNALSDDFQPFFANPYDKSKLIYFIADPSHMLKLMRNLLGNHKMLFDENDEKIEWSLFVKLQEISTMGNLLTHKLTKKHTKEWGRNKMNVRLASETYSGSVVNSMHLLRMKQQPGFENSEPTERFTDIMDKAFDILNSCNPRHSNPYKRALNIDNQHEVFEFIEKAIPYFKSLKMIRKQQNEIQNKVHVLETINKVPVLGFLMNLHNIPLMYNTYVLQGEHIPPIEPKPMKYFRSYAMSQDHLELFFGKIRSKNGHNDNPNVIQFKGAYRKLLSNVEIKPPESSNCMVLDSFDTNLDTFESSDSPNSNVFLISSKPSTHAYANVLSDPIFIRNLEQFNEVNTYENVEEIEEMSDLQAMDTSEYLLDGLANISIAYAANVIEGRLASRFVYCECCSDIFLKNKKINDPAIGILSEKSPCVSTYYICKIADRYFNAYKPDKKNQFDYRVLYYKIFQDIDYNKIYTESDFKDHEEHQFHLVKFIVKTFLQMKTKQISKEITYNEYKKIIRSKLTSWIHYSGQ